jgi:hypothetical protein
MKTQNRKSVTYISATSIVALLFLAFSFFVYRGRAYAQQTASNQPLMLVTWFGPGAIALPNGPDWKP